MSKFERGHRLSSVANHQKLAAGYRVPTSSISALIEGRLTPEEVAAEVRQRSQVVELTPRYAAMEAVRGMARASGFDDKFVATWDVLLDADDQPSPGQLWTRCQADYARWRRKTRSSGDPLADLDEPPPKKR